MLREGEEGDRVKITMWDFVLKAQNSNGIKMIAKVSLLLGGPLVRNQGRKGKIMHVS